MKQIVFAFALLFLSQSIVFAQKEKAVAEKDVRASYVKDFTRNVKEASNIQWYRMDSLTYKVTYLDNENSKQAMVYTNKGSETHYYIDSKYYPTSIKDSVAHNYRGYNITSAWVRKVHGKYTYQARIAKKKGFLWWKKENDVKVLNFETDGKFINAQ